MNHCLGVEYTLRFPAFHRDCGRNLYLGGEQLRHIGEAQQFQDAGGHVDQFQLAVALVDGGGFQPDERP